MLIAWILKLSSFFLYSVDSTIIWITWKHCSSAIHFFQIDRCISFINQDSFFYLVVHFFIIVCSVFHECFCPIHVLWKTLLCNVMFFYFCKQFVCWKLCEFFLLSKCLYEPFSVPKMYFAYTSIFFPIIVYIFNWTSFHDKYLK